MKLALTGQAYSERSLAVAAQTCVNLFPSRIDDPQETEKARAVLYGIPGKHLFTNLVTLGGSTATPIRGVWSGGGRLFVVAGDKYFEVTPTGSVGGAYGYPYTVTVYSIADDATHSPVQMFANGNQLMILSAGFVYCDNGAGPVLTAVKVLTGTVDTISRTSIVTTNVGGLIGWNSGDYFTNIVIGDKISLDWIGTVDTAGTAVTLATGPTFQDDGTWAGMSITINSVVYKIASVTNPALLVLTTSAGTQTGTAYKVSKSRTVSLPLGSSQLIVSDDIGIPVAGVTLHFYAAQWRSGDLFTDIVPGAQLIINAAFYTVDVLGLEGVRLMLTATPGNQSDVAYAAYVLNGTADVDATGKIVTWKTGDTFPLYGIIGQRLCLNGVSSAGTAVLAVHSPQQLIIVGVSGPLTNKTFGVNPYVAGKTGAFLDGYFLACPGNSRQVQFSGINNGTAWNGTDVFLKESYPDHIQSILGHNQQLYLFGEESFEVYQNTGDATTPFQRIAGSAQRIGSISPWGPCALDGRVYFVGGSQGQVVAYVLDGFTPHRISTHAIESHWNSLGLGRDCISYGYTEEGHSFLVINFGGETWAFDTTTGVWHERKFWTGTAWAPYRTMFHTFIPEWGPGIAGTGAGGKHITGGYDISTLVDGGKLFQSSVNFYDDNGADMKWERSLPYNYQNGGNRIYFGRMTLECETGAVASGAEPVITRERSDDRGNTFTFSEPVGLGVHDDFSKRVFWPTGGSSRDRVWRFSCISQSKVALANLECEMTNGTA